MRRVETPAGVVELVSVEQEGPVTEVYVARPRCGDPHFRIINAPTVTTDGRRDPVAALCEAIARAGGAVA